MKDHLSLKSRVDQLKMKLEKLYTHPDHQMTIETIPFPTIAQLKMIKYFPLDMLLILEHIGAMRRWGCNQCAMIDWWNPCTIRQSENEDRCFYSFPDDIFGNSESLLIFAWDCHAICYFYDTSFKPWKMMCADGLTCECYPELGEPVLYEADSDSALSLIENWVDSCFT